MTLVAAKLYREGVALHAYERLQDLPEQQGVV